jgi:ABC-type tungstate transport system substrate-binding protein
VSSLVFVLVYVLFARWIARAAGHRRSTGAVARTFVLSLIPIAVAYPLAHSLSYFLIQGQLMIRLASDPFGFGWNVFGTARYRPDIGIVGARFVWYMAVIAIVLGHIIAVYVAHAIALRQFRQPRVALRSQIPMLVLMVGYTVISLWILAQPIVETRPN